MPSLNVVPRKDRPFNWTIQKGNIYYAINIGGPEVVSDALGLTWYADFGRVKGSGFAILLIAFLMATHLCSLALRLFMVPLAMTS